MPASTNAFQIQQKNFNQQIITGKVPNLPFFSIFDSLQYHVEIRQFLGASECKIKATKDILKQLIGGSVEWTLYLQVFEGAFPDSKNKVKFMPVENWLTNCSTSPISKHQSLVWCVKELFDQLLISGE